MIFATTKYFVMSITLKNSPFQFSYSLSNTPRFSVISKERKGIDCIDRSNRSAPWSTIFFNNNYSRYSSVSSMLTDLNWPSLQSRRRICDLGMFYKLIQRGQVYISLSYDRTSVPVYSRTRASHN